MLRVIAERLLLRLWFPNDRQTPLARLLLAALWLVLLPLSWLTEWVAVRRRAGIEAQRLLPDGRVVVLVVGNLVAGGAGKTPATIALARALAQRGLRVGLLGHAYRAQSEGPLLVGPETPAEQAGDEAVLLALETRDLSLPVAAGRDRQAALGLLFATHPTLDIVVCDDGLQHAGLRRDIELAVFDSRGIGNGALLPAGPLREPVRHAKQMDALLLNGGTSPLPHPRIVPFGVQAQGLVPLADFWAAHPKRMQAATEWQHVPATRLRAFAGLADPARFERTLADLGLPCPVQSLGDHGQLTSAQLAGIDADLILVTAKDAVKLRHCDDKRVHVVRVAARFPEDFLTWLEQRIRNGPSA